MQRSIVTRRAIRRQHVDEVVVRAEDLDDERVVAAALHAEPRTPELAIRRAAAQLAQRDRTRARASGGSRIHGAPRLVVERKLLGRRLATRHRTRRSSCTDDLDECVARVRVDSP